MKELQPAPAIFKGNFITFVKDDVGNFNTGEYTDNTDFVAYRKDIEEMYCCLDTSFTFAKLTDGRYFTDVFGEEFIGTRENVLRQAKARLDYEYTGDEKYLTESKKVN